MKKGNDHYHAMTAEDIANFRKREFFMSQIRGNGEPNLDIQIAARKNARRGIYAAKDIICNESISFEHLSILRPTNDLAPYQTDLLIGKKAIKNIKKGTSLKKEFFH